MKKLLLFAILFFNFFIIYAQVKQITVTLDNYFNHEWRDNAAGKSERFHYLWNETDLQGFSIFGKIFTDNGAKINSMETAPSKKKLQGSDIYIIVDPDNTSDNPAPNTIKKPHINAIKNWVYKGGILVLFGNDSANCDLVNLNKLANVFGINFSDHSRNMVKGNDFEVGAVLIKENEVFKSGKKVYLKEVSMIDVKSPATALVSMNNDIIMSVSNYGKGIVFAVGDPWLYNEYIDGNKIPAEFENYKAAKDLVKWLISQVDK